MRDSSYKQYVKDQTAINKYKLKVKPGLHWITETEVKLVTKYIKKHSPQAKFGICHGARNGWEVKQFRKALGIEVIGTEISETATKFPNVIQWDFHNVKEAWLNSIDFIYSNSYDHCYNPGYCLKQWLSCLSPGGLCFIEWTGSHDKAVDWDIEKVIGKVGKLKNILEFQHPKRDFMVKVFVVGKNE